jgi:hypothetical protein
MRIKSCIGSRWLIRGFWVDQRILREDNLIIGGKFNLTLSLGEVWGNSTRKYPLAHFFVHLFEYSRLIDIEHVLVART